MSGEKICEYYNAKQIQLINAWHKSWSMAFNIFLLYISRWVSLGVFPTIHVDYLQIHVDYLQMESAANPNAQQIQWTSVRHI